MKRLSVNRFVLSLLTLLSISIACGRAAAGTTLPATTVQSQNEVVTPQEAASPAPTYWAPTTNPADLEIVDSFAFTDTLGDFQIYTLVRNASDKPIILQEMYAGLVDSAGNAIPLLAQGLRDGRELGYALIPPFANGTVDPGELVPVQFCFTCEKSQDLPKWDHYVITHVVLQRVDPIDYSTNFQATCGKPHDNGNGLYDLPCTVKNTGDKAVQFTYARYILYDQDKKMIGFGQIDGDGLAPGASEQIDLLGQGVIAPGRQVASYTVAVKGPIGP